MPDVLDDPNAVDWEQEAQQSGFTVTPKPRPLDQIDWEAEAKSAGFGVSPPGAAPARQKVKPAPIDWEAEAAKAGFGVTPAPEKVYAGPELGAITPPHQLDLNRRIPGGLMPQTPPASAPAAAPASTTPWGTVLRGAAGMALGTGWSGARAEAQRAAAAHRAAQQPAAQQPAVAPPAQPATPTTPPATPPPVGTPAYPQGDIYSGPQLGRITPPPVPTPLEPGLQRSAPAPRLPMAAGGITQAVSDVVGQSPRTDVRLARIAGLMKEPGQFLTPPGNDASPADQATFAVQQMLLNQISPYETGKALAFGLGAKGLAMLQNSKNFFALAQKVPGMEKAVDFGMRAALPAYFSGSGLVGVHESDVARREAWERGDVGGATRAATQEVVNAIMALLGAHSVNQAWQVRGAYPPTATPEEQAKAAQSGGVASAAARPREERITPETAAAAAEKLRAQGAGFAAQAWEKLNPMRTVELNIGGRKAYLVPSWTGGRPGLGNLIQYVFDENGTVLAGGKPDAVKGWLDQQSVYARQGMRSGTAAAGIPGTTYEPLDYDPITAQRVLTGTRGAAPAQGAQIPPEVDLSQVPGRGSPRYGGSGRPAGPSSPIPEPVGGAVPSVPPVSVGAPPQDDQERKPLWEMTREEIEQAYQEERGRDQRELVQLFGEEGAKRYQQLTRVANGSSPNADAAAEELGQMEAGLNEQQKRVLYGQDLPPGTPNLEDIRDYREGLSQLDPTSAVDLGKSLQWAITRVGYQPDPADMDQNQRRAYAMIREAYRIAAEKGFDTAEMSRAALTAAWGRYPDPEDAEYMMEAFLGPARERAEQEKQAQAQGQPPAVNLPPPVGTIPPDGTARSEGKVGEGAAAPNEPQAVGGVGGGESWRDTSIIIPGTEEELGAQYRLAELSDVVPSHDPSSLRPVPRHPWGNERNYNTPEGRARLYKQAKYFKPRLVVTDNGDNVNGPSVVARNPKNPDDQTLYVLGGNSRIMTIHRLAQEQPEKYRAYVEYLASRAPLYGYTAEQVMGMQNPVLVRELDQTEVPRFQKIISDLNKTGTAALDPFEQAISDSQRVSQETLDHLHYAIEKLGAKGTLARALESNLGPEVVQNLVKDGLITESARPAYLNPRTGKVTDEGKARIERLMLGRFFDSVPQMLQTQEIIQRRLERMAAPLVRLEGRPDWDALNEPIREALEILYQSDIRKMPILEELNAQASFGGESQYSPEGIAWAYILRSNGADKLGQAARKYLELEGQSRPGQDVDIFAPPPVDQATAFNTAFGELRTGKGKGTVTKEYPDLGKPIQKEEPDEEARSLFGWGDQEQPQEAEAEQPAGQEIARFPNREEGTYASVMRTRDGFAVQLHDAEDGAPLNQAVPRGTKAAAVAHAQDLARQRGLVDKAGMREAMERAQQDQAERERLNRPQFGQPARPTRPKPAKQTGLFEQEAQGGLELSGQAPASQLPPPVGQQHLAPPKKAEIPPPVGQAPAEKKSYIEQEREIKERAQNEPDPYRAHLIAIRYDPDDLSQVSSNVIHNWQQWQKHAEHAAHRMKNPDPAVREKAKITQGYADGSRELFEEGKKYIADRWGQQAADQAENDARAQWEAWGKEDKWGQRAAQQKQEAEWERQRAEQQQAPARPSLPERQELPKEKRGAAMQRNMRIADLQNKAGEVGLTPEEQKELKDLNRERAERMAVRRTQFEREQAPLFAEQIPEQKPEDFVKAAEEGERSRQELNQKFEQNAKDYRDAVAKAVTPEELAAMDKKWEGSWGPKKPVNRSTFWMERYRETFKRNPPDVSYVLPGPKVVFGGPWPIPKEGELEQAAAKHGLTPEEYLAYVRKRGREPEGLNPEGWAAQRGGEEELQARIRQVAPGSRSVPQVQEALHNQTKGNAIKQDAPDAVKLHRIKGRSRRELKIQLARGGEGEDWYGDDTKLADGDLFKAFPELKRNSAKLILFKTISASTSGSHEPSREARQAARIYAVYRESKTGRIPLKNPENGLKWVGMGATVALVKIQRMLDHFGAKTDVDRAEKRLAEFLMTDHTPDEIKKFGLKLGYTSGTVTKWIEGRIKRGVPHMKGAVVLGNKFARYFAGISGVEMDGTPIDIWMARMHYRQLGTLLDADGEEPGEPRSVGDRRLFMQAHEELGKEFGLDKETVQSLLWHYEQELYRQMGASTTTGNRSEGTLKYLEENGIAKNYTIRRRRELGLGGGAGAQPGQGRGAQTDDARAIRRGEAGPEEGTGSPTTPEVAAKFGKIFGKFRAGLQQQSFQFEDSVTHQEVDQAVRNARAGNPTRHITSVDPTRFHRLFDPARLKPNASAAETTHYLKQGAFYLSNVGDVPLILMNAPGMDAFLMAKGTWRPDNNGQHTAGIAVPPREWKEILNAEIEAMQRQRAGKSQDVDSSILHLGRLIRQAVGLPSLADQIQDAMKNAPAGATLTGVLRKVRGEWDRPAYQKHLIGVQAGKRFHNDYLKETIEEEYDHVQHMRLPGGMRSLPIQITENDPIARKAADYLHQEGYPELHPESHPERMSRNSVITSEILVRLMRGGRFHQLGLTPQEANDLAERYMAELQAKHGEKAAGIIEQIRRYALTQSPKSLLPQGRQPGVRQHATPDEIAARGPPGVQAGDGEDVSGQQDQGPDEEARALVRTRKAATYIAQKAQGTRVGKALGVTPSIERQVIPGIDLAEKAWDDFLRVFSPASRGPAAKRAGQSLRANAAHMDRVIKQANRKLIKLRPLFKLMPQQGRWDFIRRAEAGMPQQDTALSNGKTVTGTDLDRVATMLNKVNDFIRKEVENADDPNVVRIWRDLYWPNMWKETAGARPGTTQPIPPGLGRGPLYGPKSFGKQKVFQDFQEGLDAGYTPLFDNPIDYWNVKVREMAKFAMANRLKRDLKPMATFVPFGQKVPDGYDKINDAMSRVFQYSKTEKGMVYRGDWAFPQQAADIINNHLSPDPRQSVAAFRVIANLSNLALRWKLTGFYHLGATGLNAVYSHAALGLRMVRAGDMKGAAKQFAKAIPSPVTDVRRGYRLQKRFLDMDAAYDPVFQALEEGGFRAGQDPFYNSGYRDKVKEAWEAGERIMPVKGAMALAETIVSPIMEHYVPYLKMAAASDIARFELEQYQKRNGGMSPSPPRLRKIMADAVDSIDNRFGQLTYDNLFWKRMVKALLMINIMSIGWNLGTMRELMGGGWDVLRGRGVTNRIAYLVAMNVIHALAAATYQKLMTGQNPTNVKDLVFPKDGGYDERGHPTRVSPPDYAKEEWNWMNQPLDTALNKAHPFPSFLLKLVNNRDYWGSKIRNKDDDFAEQIGQLGRYVWNQEMKPLSWTNLDKLLQRGERSPGKLIASQLGFSPTPAWTELSPAEKLLADYMRDRQPIGGRPIEEAQRTTARNAILHAMRQGADEQPAIENAMNQGLIKGRDIANIRKAARLSPLQSAMSHDMLDPGQVLHIWEAATPEEQKQIEWYVRHRLQRAAGKTSANWSDEARKLALKYFGIQARTPSRLAVPPSSFSLPPQVGAGQ